MQLLVTLVGKSVRQEKSLFPVFQILIAVAAAYAAGAITLDTAIIIAFYRGVVAKRSRPGAMAAVAMSSEEVKGYLTENAVLACENSPQSVTVSGDPDEIDLVIKRICDTRPDTFCRRLKINVAYHSGKSYLFPIVFLIYICCQRHQNNTNTDLVKIIWEK